jgi:hypothetical protein
MADRTAVGPVRRDEWIKLGAFIAVAIQRSGDVIAALEARTDIPAQEESR